MTSLALAVRVNAWLSVLAVVLAGALAAVLGVLARRRW